MSLLNEADVKSRNLFDPSFERKAVIGLINKNLINLVKTNNSSFVHGLNTSQLEEHIEKDVYCNPKPCFVKWDGS